MAIILAAVTHVWHAGRMIPPGEVFSVNDAYGTKLIEGGSAKVAKGIKSEPEQQPKTTRKRKTDDDEND